jgi:hypothetical protein
MHSRLDPNALTIFPPSNVEARVLSSTEIQLNWRDPHANNDENDSKKPADSERVYLIR